MADYIENTFKNEKTGRELNVIYDGELAWLTFYDEHGKCYSKATWHTDYSKDKIEAALRQHNADIDQQA